MEMESLHSRTPDHTETAEPRPFGAPPAYKDAQVWRDLEAETGFASCADYMEFYKNVRPDFKDRLEQFRKLPEDHVTAQEGLPPHARRAPIVIYDLSYNENLPSSLSLRRHCHSGTELIQALREPPANIHVQLVVWSFGYGRLNQEMAEALILGLKLDPHLLADYDHLAMKDYHPRSKGLLTSQIKSVVGNDTVTTLSQNILPGLERAVPVLLVAFRYDASYGRFSVKNILAKSDQGLPPFHRSALGESRGTEDDNETKIGRLYARSVENFMAQFRFAADPSTSFLLLAATSPLLSIEAYRVQGLLDELPGTYNKLAKNRIQGRDTSDRSHRELDKDLEIQRLNSRRTLEEGEAHVSQILRYLESEIDSAPEPSYQSIKADWRSLIDEARRLGAEVRDYMQLQVGNLSLEESRRSIELSNIQIRESQKGKF